MRYELGVLQLLVASGGRRNATRVEVVERALGVRPGSLDPAIRFLQGRGLVNPDGRPTDAGVSRARGLSRHVRRSVDTPRLPSRLPPPSGVFQSEEKDERDERNTMDIDVTEIIEEPSRRSA